MTPLNKIWFLGFYLIFIQTFCFAQNYSFENFNSKQELPEPYIYTINQDKLGQLWLGTGKGLVKYNGYEFKTFTTNDSLADNFITCSFNNKDILYLGHSNGRISIVNNNQISFLYLNNSINTAITDIQLGPDSNLWASSYSQGIFDINNDKLISFHSPTTITSFYCINNKTILVGTDKHLLLCQLNKNKLVTIKKFTVNSQVVDIIEYKTENIFLIATNLNIYSYNHSDSSLSLNHINNNVIQADMIQSIFLDRNNSLWISCFGDGLIKSVLLNDSISVNDVFTESNGWTTNYVKCVFEDREGIIWTGNYGTGLGKLTPRLFTNFNLNTAGNYTILSIAKFKNKLWLGTHSGLLIINENREPEPVPDQLRTLFNHTSIPALYEYGGKLLIGTKEKGAYIYNEKNNKLTRFNLPTGTLENNISYIYSDNQFVWIGTKKGLFKFDNNNRLLKWFTIENGGLPHNLINHVFTDSDKRTWVSCASNVACYIQNDSVVRISLHSASLNYNISSIMEDRDRNIWISTMGAGVFYRTNDSIIQLTKKSGLNSNYCYSQAISNNILWVVHKDGLSSITNKFNVQEHYGISPLKTLVFNTNSALSGDTEELWIGHNNGLLKIHSQNETFNNKPLVHIESVLVNNKTVDHNEGITLKSGKYIIKIKYIGIYLKEPEEIEYHYMLEGFDTAPQATSKTHITYNGISEGNYRFIISSAHSNGLKSEVSSLNIRIKKPLWKYTGTYILGICVLFFTLLLFIRRQKLIIQRENNKLEKVVAERTKELLQQKKEVEKQRDLNDEKNRNITDSIVYAARIQRAIMPPIELLHSLLPNSFIINKPRDIVSGDFYWVAEKDDKIIFAIADCTGHGVPGAFMNILGNTLLNDIVYDKQLTEPGLILNRLREEVINALRQSSDYDSTFDSIHMGICALNKASYALQYSGSYHPLVYVKDNKLSVVKPDRFPIGISDHKNVQFTQHQFQFKKGDRIYMYSDGFQDQYGGESYNKFSRKRLIQAIDNISKVPFNNQKELFEKEFYDWMGINEQTDDMIFLGVKL